MINKELSKGQRYYGLDAPIDFWFDLDYHPDKIKECCNGVGSQVGLWGKITYHIIPNTIYLLDVTEASDVHDYMYCYPEFFKTRQDALNHKHFADNLLLDNIVTIIERDTRWEWLKSMRRYRAMTYYNAVDSMGDESFLAGKMIG